MNPTDAVPDSILRHRPFVLYWSARTCAAMGFQMLGVAVAWQMYALTGSAFDLGLVGLVQFLPAAAFMLVAGQIADRYDRRRLLQICQARRGPGRRGIGHRLRLRLGEQGIHPGGGVRLRSRARVRGADPADLAAGGGAGGVVSARGRRVRLHHAARDHHRPGDRRRALRLRRDRSLHVCCALFLASVVLLAFVHIERFVSTRSPVNLEAFFAGIAYIRRNPIVLGVISLDLFAVLLGGTTALLPIFADEVFHIGPEGLGLLRAAPAVGALAITAVLTHLAADAARRPHHVRQRRLLRAGHHRVRAVDVVHRCRWPRWRCWARPTRSAW